MALVPNATKTLGNIRDAVYFLVREDETTFEPEEVDRAINMGMRSVFDVMAQQPSIIWTSTQEGVREYEIPEARTHEGVAIVDAVWIDDTGIGPIPYSYLASDAEDGEPEGYYVLNRTLGLDPTPDAVYKLTIAYRQDYKELTLATDVTTMNDNEVDAGIYFAAYILKTIDEEYDAASMFKGQYEEAIARISLLKPGIYKGDIPDSYGGAI